MLSVTRPAALAVLFVAWPLSSGVRPAAAALRLWTLRVDAGVVAACALRPGVGCWLRWASCAAGPRSDWCSARRVGLCVSHSDHARQRARHVLLALRALRCVLQRGCERCVVRGLHRVALRCVRRGASAVRAARWHGAVRAEAQCLRALLIVGNIVCFDGPAAGGRLLASRWKVDSCDYDVHARLRPGGRRRRAEQVGPWAVLPRGRDAGGDPVSLKGGARPVGAGACGQVGRSRVLVVEPLLKAAAGRG